MLLELALRIVTKLEIMVKRFFRKARRWIVRTAIRFQFYDEYVQNYIVAQKAIRKLKAKDAEIEGLKEVLDENMFGSLISVLDRIKDFPPGAHRELLTEIRTDIAEMLGVTHTRDIGIDSGCGPEPGVVAVPMPVQPSQPRLPVPAQHSPVIPIAVPVAANPVPVTPPEPTGIKKDIAETFETLRRDLIALRPKIRAANVQARQEHKEEERRGS
jgi:hypothetical protein